MVSQSDTADLARFLADSKRPENVMCFQELQGFLFAVASSPDLVLPSEWFPIISDDAGLGFKDESEAQKLMGLIMNLYNEINSAVQERSKRMPVGCEFRAYLEENFDEDLPISQWSRGFMIGHDWLADVWDKYVPDEMDEELGSAAMVLSFFSSRRLAEMYHAEATTTPRRRKPRTSFLEYAETVRRLFPDALASYAHIGRTISEVLAGSPGLDA